MYTIVELKQTKTYYNHYDHAKDAFDRFMQKAVDKAVLLLSDGKVTKSHNWSYFSFPKAQAQYDTRRQLQELVDLANMNGLYDAADVVSRYLDKAGV